MGNSKATCSIFKVALAVAALSLCPAVARADGLLFPLSAYRLNAVFYLNFALVILVEGIAFKLGLKAASWVSVLWKTIVINAASSLAAYPLHFFVVLDYPRVSEQTLPLFVTTVVVEWPLIRLLFRRNLASWKRAFLLTLAANILSYAALLSIEKPVQKVWLARLVAQDTRTLAAWKSPELLAAASGRIYGAFFEPDQSIRLSAFDFASDRWQLLTNSPPINPRYWDVSGRLVAFLERDPLTPSLKVASIPEFTFIREIELLPTEPHYGEGWEIKISPDQRKVAVLFPQYPIRAALSKSSYTILGITSLLVVYDIASGVLLGTCPRKAAYGLCWLPDARTVLFNALRNEQLHEPKQFGAGWSLEYTRAKPEAQYEDAPLYAFDVDRGTVKLFSELRLVHLAADTEQLFCTKGLDSLAVLDLRSLKTSTIAVGKLGSRSIEVSPDGRFVIVPFALRWPFAYEGYPAIIDLQDLSRRHALSLGLRYVWTEDRSHSPAASPAKRQ